MPGLGFGVINPTLIKQYRDLTMLIASKVGFGSIHLL